MPASKSSNNRSVSGAPGVKVLITAASLAATVGGWAMLSNQEGVSSATSTPAATATQSQAARSIQLPPLPTLIPPPDPKSLTINAQPVVVPSSQRSAVAAAPAQAAAAPAPQIAGLRVVNAPSVPSGGSVSSGGGGGGTVSAAPPPATTTHSSKP